MTITLELAELGVMLAVNTLEKLDPVTLAVSVLVA